MSGLETLNRRESALRRLKDFLLRERQTQSKSLNSSSESDDSITFNLDESFQKVLQTHKIKQEKMQENKENLYKSACENTTFLSANQSVSKNSVYSLNDTTLLDDTLCESDDDCFEDLERMCNKTLSDPNNTIHEYIERLKQKKKYSNCTDAESEIIDRVLKDIDANLDEAKTKLGDQTQLNDIEAPSCLWESTFSGDTSPFERSPEKRHVLRAGPILEESRNESVERPSSYKTAQHAAESSSSDQYETANETMSGGRPNHDDTLLIDLDGGAIDSNSWKYRTVTKDISSLLDETLNLSTSRTNVALKSEADRSLIDLNTSLNYTAGTELRAIEKHAEFETISLLSDEEHDDQSLSHNTGFSLQLDQSYDDIDAEEMNHSRQFDDTLDEINYIMKEGLKYIGQNPSTPTHTISTKTAITPSPIASPKTPNTVISKPKKIISVEKPAQELFKKPQVFSKIPQCKSLVSKKTSHFQHIVSPVAAYIKNTPKTPITTELRPIHDIFQSKAVRGLDYSSSSLVTKKDEPAKDVGASLPKKAYISSEYQHVVDQRKAVLIPGGEKIHRYLHSTKVPSVIRHEGKMKSNMMQRERAVDTVADSSLADLSTISGDVSVHVLKDAKT